MSVVIITRNEAHNLPRLLEAVKDLADEVVVFDSGSTDGTPEIARRSGAKVEDCEWEGWSATKNKANLAAGGDWILSLDADETPDTACIDAVRAHMAQGAKTANGDWRVGEINRLTNYCGRWVRHSGWFPDRKVRLWPTGAAFWDGAIHEELRFNGPVESIRLEGLVHHYSYHHRADHLAQIEKFGRAWAEDQYERGNHTAHPLVWAKVCAQWCKTYLLKGGFRDGSTGWTIARLSAWATWRKHARLRALQRPLPPAPRHILISRTDALGDLVLTLPLAKALRRQFPEAEISLITRPYARPVAEAAMDVDQVIGWLPEHDADPSGRGAALIRSLACDAVVFAFPDKAVIKACCKAKVPVRLGTGRRWHALGRMTHHNWDGRRDSGGHESWHGLRLLMPLGIEADDGFHKRCHLSSPIPSSAAKAVLETFGSPPILLHPGSHGSAGNWPAERFASLAMALAEEGHAVGFTGTSTEGEAFDRHLPHHPMVRALFGRLDLKELLFVQAHSLAVVASSTGPLHTAAALGTPVLGLYGNRAPEWARRWRPIGPWSDVIETGHFLENGALDIPLEEVHRALNNLTVRAGRV